ncbi:hypothetical protein WI61_08120 [Burkholderia cepacia]|nr:hypothetical protein WI61_08120 [Burkholderia cepacia]KVC11715.1 hypothetical protein WI68_38755 [Burkholderia cepacia]
MEITPPQLQMHFDRLFRAGCPPINTVGAPGTQGAATAGTQGIGVSTPIAAAVAAATVGFAGELHMANVGMFASGLEFIMVAAGRPSTMTLAVGSTTSVAGAAPKVQLRTAPSTTCSDISLFP